MANLIEKIKDKRAPAPETPERRDVPIAHPDPQQGLTSAQVRERADAGWTNAPVDPPGKTVKQIVLSNIFTYFNMLFFLLALGLTVYPIFSSRYNEVHQSQIHTEYQDAVQALPDTAVPEARTKAQAYNEELWSNIVRHGSYSKDSVTSAVEEYAQLLDLTSTGTMGYVYIPKLGVTLPIYHGTEEETLERGVGHLIGSSLPIGGSSTHAILTGHSGLASQKMFSDLDKLEVGDTFYLEVLNEVLAYEVDQINTVLPHDTTYLGLEEGKDLCTLVTLSLIHI